MELFGNGAAADKRPPFKEERLESGLGEIAGGDQPVMSGTENDDARFRHR